MLIDRGANHRVASSPREDVSSGKMRLLVAHNVSPERAGGMSRIMGFIHDEIAREQPGWQIEWFCADRLPPGTGGFWSRFAFPWHLFRFLRAEAAAGQRFDVVNVHEPAAALAVALRRMLGGPKMVVTSHGLEARAWEVDREDARLGRRALSWRSRLARPLTILWPARFALRRADHVFCLNEEDRSYLAREFGVPFSRSTRLCPGVDPLFAAAAARRDYSRAERLVFAGTWRPHKGTVDLVRAFVELAARHPRLTLTILGAGFSADAVRAEFPAEVRERVQVMSSMTEAKAAQAFAQSDFFVLPSLFEGTPLTLLEAMASGLPIVTTDTCGMRDVIRHQENGLLVPLRSPLDIVEAVESLITDNSLRERLGVSASRDAAAHYRWSDVARSPLRAYRSMACRR